MSISSRIALLLALLFVLSGCLELSESVEIHRDGAATVRMSLDVSPALQGVIERTAGLRAMALLMDPEALAKELPKGIKLANAYRYSEGGRQVYVNELFIADMQAVETGATSIFKGQDFSVGKNADGNISYTRTIDYSQMARDPELAAMLQENRMGVRGILAQSPYRFELSGPLTILSTNGTREGRAVVWEYSLLNMLHGPVKQEVVFAAPTLVDYALGVGRKLLRPNVFFLLAVAFLAIFFLAVLRRRPGERPFGHFG